MNILNSKFGHTPVQPGISAPHNLRENILKRNANSNLNPFSRCLENVKKQMSAYQELIAAFRPPENLCISQLEGHLHQYKDTPLNRAHPLFEPLSEVQERIRQTLKLALTPPQLTSLREMHQIYEDYVTQICKTRFSLFKDTTQINSSEEIELLLLLGTKMDGQDESGNTLLHRYAEEENLNGLAFLLKHGANCNIKADALTNCSFVMGNEVLFQQYVNDSPYAPRPTFGLSQSSGVE
jgi:hypothetical protein